MGRIEPAFQTKLQQRPEEVVRLIVRVTGDMPQAIQGLKELGATVVRSFTLIRAVAVSCSAATALILLQEPWVEAIEEDRQVFVQAQGKEGSKSKRGRRT